MKSRLQAEIASLHNRILSEYDLAERQAAYREAREREASVLQTSTLLKQQKAFLLQLPASISKHHEMPTSFHFGLSELALPVGQDINGMPMFRFRVILQQVLQADTVTELQEIFKAAHARSLFCDAEQVRELFINTGKSELRKEIWRICGHYIPDRENIPWVLEVLPSQERSDLRRIWYPTART
ncbi:hypothetical protein GMRT_15524 [Giardia muris]|uniref:Uncharacterized protein n=1 Tax=Giardia muris TaxID=5742 RepID=A0A4Z1TBE8_GIAMU|nr:hypothetical protein GMRT_15524 [Giardia muris]|eukprot:TNJ29849.1 hypothetical protein GMRT_15524 [Giardia muris]